MTTIAVIYDRDDECQDPKDHDQLGRRHAELIPDNVDAILIWREDVGDQDADGHSDIHVLGSGALENIDIPDVEAFCKEIGLIPR